MLIHHLCENELKRKRDGRIKENDTLYFHHNPVIQRSTVLEVNKNLLLVIGKGYINSTECAN